METNLVDLHTHSTASDGTDTPAGLVARARELGLAAIALTDHDTLGGLEEGEEAARGLGINFIRGCEISTRSDAGEHHILGLWVPRESAPLKNWLEAVRQRRNERNAEMVARLRALGFAITLEEVRDRAQGSVGRPHMAALLVEKGYARDTNAAFRDFLGIRGKAFVPKRVPPPEEAVRVLTEVGATAVLAHPFLTAPAPEMVEALTRRLAGNGLDAIEAWHTSHSEAHTRECVDLAARLDLGLSGGSDYHGVNKPGIQPGTGYGGLRVPMTVLEALKKRRRARGLPC
ncbi:PHP domain-containing protein [Desulfovibrio sp.]|uniref:PHP domain-containing protein n=1 Tax=Desulfovibrio sp. TaxID=885 RepID=UPI0023C0EB60|nr:PHP domain-containing protein [Desulfovibrio sp.]MDE7241140.1 PHP domain-containing protein [Desulfovibrio sp.]